MTLKINITPRVQAELARQAASHGMDLEVYAAKVLEEAVRGPQRRDLSQEEFEESLNRMAQFSDKIPPIPDDALSREDIYRDHD